MSNNEDKLKPVVFEKGRYNYTRDNRLQQDLVLRAMSVSYDPQIWMKMAGIKSMAELQKTLDRISIRKDYHIALSENKMDLNWVTSGIKKLCENSRSDMVKLQGYKTILKSLGLEDYKETPEDQVKSWEDMLLNAIDDEKQGIRKKQIYEYEVKTPEVPEKEQKRIDAERELGKSLYEGK